MAAQLIIPPATPIFDNGVIEAGARMHVYQTGTTTPITVYTDAALTTEATNPVIANGNGVLPATYWDNDTEVRVRIEDSDGAVISDIDPYTGGIGAGKVATRTALKALGAQAGNTIYLTETGREGTFVFRSGDYSSEVTNDPEEGVYIKADDTAASSGAWVRQYVGFPDAGWWGVARDGSTDDTDAMQAAIDFVHYHRLGRFWLGSGTIKCNVVVKSDVIFVGASQFQTEFNPATDAPIFTIDQTKSVVRFGWEYLSIIGDTTMENQSGVVLDPNGASGYFVDKPHFYRVRIEDCGKRGIDLQGGDATTGGFVQGFNSNDLRIRGCMAAGLYAKGVVLESTSTNTWVTQNNAANLETATEARADEGNLVLISDGTRCPSRWSFFGGGFAGQVMDAGEDEISTVNYIEGREILFETANMEHGKIFAHIASSNTRDICIRNCRIASGKPMESFFKIDAVEGCLLENIICATSSGCSFNHIVDAFNNTGVLGLKINNVRQHGGGVSASSTPFNISNRLRINRRADSQIEVTGNSSFYAIDTNTGDTTAADTQVRTIAKQISQTVTVTDQFEPGERITLHARDGVNNPVTVKTGAGNIVLSGGDYTLDDNLKSITVEWDQNRSRFVEVARA